MRMPRTPRLTPGRIAKIDAVTAIVKRVCGLSQTEAFNIAKNACVWNVPRRSAAGHSAKGD